jgi:septal ring factor EnvC (AmiA/AmiB activator)
MDGSGKSFSYFWSTVPEACVMKTADEEIQALTEQLKEWNVQIAVLTAKQNAAAATAQKFTQEIYELRAKHSATSQQLRELELHESGMYMWENIGDGG